MAPTELDDLYQSVLLDHSRHRRNYGELPDATHTACGSNASCGDEVTLQARISPEGKVEEIRFTGQGCAISQAAASLLTVKTRGKSHEEALALERAVHELIMTGETTQPDVELGDLMALGGVSKFPQRVKCAALPWNALREILGQVSAGPPGSRPGV